MRCGVPQEARVDAGVAERKRVRLTVGPWAASAGHDLVGGVLRLPEIDPGLVAEPVQTATSASSWVLPARRRSRRARRRPASRPPDRRHAVGDREREVVVRVDRDRDSSGDRRAHGRDARGTWSGVIAPPSRRRRSRRRRVGHHPRLLGERSRLGHVGHHQAAAALASRARAPTRCAGARCRPRCSASPP